MNPRRQLKSIDDRLTSQDTTIKEPPIYLGADIGKHYLSDGCMAWFASSSKYTAAKAITAVEQEFGTDRFVFIVCQRM